MSVAEGLTELLMGMRCSFCSLSGIRLEQRTGSSGEWELGKSGEIYLLFSLGVHKVSVNMALPVRRPWGICQRTIIVSGW